MMKTRQLRDAMADRIPVPEEIFDRFLTTLHGRATAVENPLRLTPEELADLRVAFGAAGAAWKRWRALPHEAQAQLAEKNGSSRR